MERREFQLIDGSSRKFWAVSVQGESMTVQFGKIGTAGQTQLKTFADEAKATAEAQKLIAEKTRKGYAEVGSPAPAAPAAEAAPPEPKPAATADAVARRIRMPAEELDPPPVAPKPPWTPQRPFDLAKLKAKLKATGDGPDQAFDAPDGCTGEEARFWFRALTGSGKPDQCAKPIPIDGLCEGFRRRGFYNVMPRLLQIQAAWLDPADLIEVAVRSQSLLGGSHNVSNFLPWLREEFYPRLDAQAMGRVRERFRALLKGDDETTAPASVLARDAGVGADVLAYARGLTKDTLADHFAYQNWQCGFLSLDDPADVVEQYRRLGLFVDWSDARAFLAKTKYVGLALLGDSIPRVGSADGVVKMLGVLLLVEAPEVAPALLSVKAQSKLSKVQSKVAEWLDKHRDLAAVGLAAVEGEKGPVSAAARAWLDDHRKRQSGPAAGPEPVPAAVAKPRAAVAAPPAPPRKLSLAPEDRRLCEDYQRTPRQPQAERPFDFQAAYKEMLADGKVPACRVTAEEARFWLRAWEARSDSHDDGALARSLKALTPAKLAAPMPLDKVKAAFDELFYWDVSPPILRLQRSALSPGQLIDVTCHHPVAGLDSVAAAGLAAWLEDDVFPDYDEAAMKAVREKLSAVLSEGEQPACFVAAVLARRAGLAAELSAFVKKQKKLTPQWSGVVLGLDPAEMVEQARRLGLKFGNPGEARQWLALTGHDALGVLRDSVLAARRGADGLALLDVLCLAESPEAAVALTEVKLAGKPQGGDARVAAWLRTHRDHALAGLTPLSADESPLGEAARAWLAENGGGPPPGETPPGGTPSAEGLRSALDAVKVGKLPSFADPVVLPPLMGLPPADVQRVLSALASSTLAGPHPLVGAMRRQGDRAAMAAFAWAVFEGWLAAGAPSKEKWALLALGHFGTDATVTKLSPLVRAWPGESQHQRAVTGLEVLRTIGTDLALTQLNGMALKLKFKALQERARALMDAIAADRGLSREQLEDRIVPDCGLGDDGSLAFDFGPRSFRFAFTSDLTPAVVDQAGKETKDLPKPGTKDDPAKAAEAVAAWKALKAALRSALPIQVDRLEEAMIAGRAWTPEEFHALLAFHPLLGHVVRRLVWQAGATSFRVTDAKATAAADGSPVSLQGASSVRVAHRLRLTPAQVEAWRVAMDATGMEPPFPQLERSTFAPRPEEADGTDFVRPAVAVPTLRLRGTLEARGWRRLMHDQGGITGFSKAYPAAGVTAVATLDGTILIGYADDVNMRVRAAYFVAGTNHPHGPCSDEVLEGLPRLLLSGVDAVAFSETANDLMMLAPTGKG